MEIKFLSYKLFIFYLLDKNQSDFRRFKLKSCKYSLVEQTSIKKLLHILIYLIQHRGHKQLFQENFYNYYAVIPRGTISVCQNRIIKKSLLIKALNFIPKKEFKKILIKRFIIPSFIGSFCLNNIFEYFHSN